MSVDDFCALTPSEFSEVCHAYNENAMAQIHGDWERMRMLATITIQPHIKGTMSPERLLPFPWERKVRDEAPKVGKDEAKARFEAIMQKRAVVGASDIES